MMQRWRFHLLRPKHLTTRRAIAKHLWRHDRIANLDVGDGTGDPAPSTTSGMGRPISPAVGPLFNPGVMFGRRGDPNGWFW